MYKKISEHESINVIYNSTLPVVRATLGGDAAIFITDNEKVLHYESGKDIDFKLEPGTPIKDITEIMQVIETGKSINSEVKSGKIFEMVGVEFKSYLYPIYEEDKIVGALSLIASLRKKCL